MFIGTGNLDFMEFGLFFFANGGIQVFTADNIDVVDGEIEFALGPTDATVSYTEFATPAPRSGSVRAARRRAIVTPQSEKILS